MHIKHLFLALIISNVFTYAHSMQNIEQENTEYNLSCIQTWAPEDVWLHIIACSDKKWKMRETCSYFRERASTKNEKLFLQNPLVIVPEALQMFTLYYADFTNNDILNNLLHHRADPNSVDDNGQSAMHYIAKNGNLEMIKTVSNHPDFDATIIANDDKSPLFLAAQCGHENIVDYILNHYSVNHNDMLFFAMQYDLPSFIEKLLPYITQADTKGPSMSLCECQKNYVHGNLHCAATKGYNDVAQILIDKGTPIDLKNDNDKTPLHYAITRNSTDMIKLLIKNKANVNSADIGLFTPLHNAVSNGRMTRALFLLLHGADINAKDRSNQTALHIASKKGYVKIVQLLLAYNASLNEYDSSNKSPLYYAGNPYIIELLVRQPNINLIIDNNCKTQLLSIIAERCRDYPNKVIDLTAITEIDTYGQSPLSYALWNKNISLLHKILQKSVFKINVLYGKNTKGYSDRRFEGNTMTALDIALQLAQKNNNAMQEIIDLLIERGAKTKAQLEKDGLIEKI